MEKRLVTERLDKEKENSGVKEKENNVNTAFSYFSGPSKNPGKYKIEIYFGVIDCFDEEGKIKEFTFPALDWWGKLDKICHIEFLKNEPFVFIFMYVLLVHESK